MLLIKLLPLLALVAGERSFFNSLLGDLKEMAGQVGKGMGALVRSLKFMEDFVDSSVEEECLFRCPEGGVPVARIGHVPGADGCGSFGVLHVGPEELPRPEMVRCCNAHDWCYDTCNEDKDACDRAFRRCLYRKCQDMDYVDLTKCRAGAKLLYVTTTALGCASFKAAQASACVCVPIDIPYHKSEL